MGLIEATSPFPSMSRKNNDQTLEIVYAFLEAYITEHGYSPSLREIGEGCYLGRSTVAHYLDRLEILDRIRREPGQSRSITLLHAAAEDPPKTGQKVGQTSVIQQNISAILKARKERVSPSDT